MGVTGSSLLLLVNITVMVAGYYLFRDGAVTIGTVYLLISYAKLLAQPIWELYHQMRQFQTIGASVERLIELQGIPREIEDGPGAVIAGGRAPCPEDGAASLSERQGLRLCQKRAGTRVRQRAWRALGRR